MDLATQSVISSWQPEQTNTDGLVAGSTKVLAECLSMKFHAGGVMDQGRPRLTYTGDIYPGLMPFNIPMLCMMTDKPADTSEACPELGVGRRTAFNSDNRIPAQFPVSRRNSIHRPLILPLCPPALVSFVFEPFLLPTMAPFPHFLEKRPFIL